MLGVGAHRSRPVDRWWPHVWYKAAVAPKETGSSDLDYAALCEGHARLATQERVREAELDRIIAVLTDEVGAASNAPPDRPVRAELGDRTRIDGGRPLTLRLETPSGDIETKGALWDRREADGSLRWWDVELSDRARLSVHPASPTDRVLLVSEVVRVLAERTGLRRTVAQSRTIARCLRFPETDPQMRPWRREAPGWAQARLREAWRAGELVGVLGAARVLWGARRGLRRELAFASHRVLRRWNTLLLPPLAVTILLEGVLGGLPELVAREVDQTTALFCASFFAEWLLGLLLARKRLAYLGNVWTFVDFVSALPMATLFQVARVGRASRVLRVVRLMKLARGRRLLLPGQRMLRALGVAASATLSGAIALEAVEQGTVPGLGEALWWSLVTVSTVGYGDITPESAAGRVVAGILIVLGLGVFSYTTGQITSAIEDPEEERILQTVEELRQRLVRMEAQLGEVGKRLEGGNNA